MTFQHASGSGGSARHKLNGEVSGGRHVVQIEIDQPVIGGHTVGVMAGSAGSLVLHDVLPMGLETLIAQDAVATVAFVAERVVGGALPGQVGQYEPPFQQWRKG